MMSDDSFDGAAISQKDREFLASLDRHPLKQNPLYGAPCPPAHPPPIDEAGCKARFNAALNWVSANYAYCKDAFMGKGGVYSLVDGKCGSIAALRSHMLPYALMEQGPRGGIKIISPVDTWMRRARRMSIDGAQTRFDQPRPTFTEDGYTFFNRYRPTAHPAGGGEIETFEAFFARLVPDDAEREWLWNWLAHKARRPWVPMVAVIMVAEEFGTGRGTLYTILDLMFGKTYVVPCSFDELTGKSAAARFNARMADALFAVINEAVSEDGHQQVQRRLAYDALKNAIEPSPTAQRRFEQKNQWAFAQQAAYSVIIATQHRDVVKLPHDDRRFSVITCGRPMTAQEREEIRAWMAVPENIGALHRALLATPAVPLDVYDPYGVPPPFAGRLEMIGMGKTRIEDAYEEAMGTLGTLPLFTMAQAKRLIGYFGRYTSGDWSDRAQHAIAKNAYRLRNGRTRHNGRREVIYARTKVEQRRWQAADKRMVLKALDDAEKRITRVVDAGIDELRDLAEQMKAASDPKGPAAEDEQA
jgi:hypothetical protein